MKNIRAIRSEADYDWALREVAPYFIKEPQAETPEAERFDVLSALIDAYEENHWPIEPADPVEAIRYKMEIAGLKQADLAQLLGSMSRASEILNRRRALTTEMIYKLSSQWGIPAESLIRPYHLEQS
ncbi:MAG: helix-turn-helix domain-containing protein [Alphaproteobacteria bacterium]|nr:helix-turn-helix domain-containing protein [Alphaproteobacteria bacterium]